MSTHSHVCIITDVKNGMDYYARRDDGVVHINTLHNTYHIAYDSEEFEKFLYSHFLNHSTPIKVSDKSFTIEHSDYDASFLRYPMSLDCEGGEVFYSHPKDSDSDKLVHGEKYVVERIDAGNCSSSVYLEGISIPFNTVRFTEIMDVSDPYYVRREAERKVEYYNSNEHVVDLLDTMISDVKSPISRWRDDKDIIVRFLNEYKDRVK